jgi:drug/metabolite transporter (DMT)-like permease
MLACLLWGFSFIASIVALRTTPALTVASMRVVMAGACFAAWLALRGRRLEPGGFKWWLELFVLSLIGMGHYAVQTFGLQYTTASNASLYVVTGPISILLLGAIFLHERITLKKATGILLAVVGVLIVMGLETLLAFELQSNMLGDALVLASIVMWGIFTVFGKKMTDQLGALALTGITTIMGAVWMFPIGWWALEKREMALAAIPPSGWLAISFLGVGCSFGATLCYFIALQHTESQKVGVYLYSIPPLTAIFASIFLGERIGVNLVFGGALVFAGVWLTEKG